MTIEITEAERRALNAAGAEADITDWVPVPDRPGCWCGFPEFDDGDPGALPVLHAVTAEVEGVGIVAVSAPARAIVATAPTGAARWLGMFDGLADLMRARGFEARCAAPGCANGWPCAVREVASLPAALGGEVPADWALHRPMGVKIQSRSEPEGGNDG